MRSMHPNVIKPKRYADGTDPLTELWLRRREDKLREVEGFTTTIVPDDVKDLFDKFDITEVMVELLPDGTEYILGDSHKVHVTGDHCGSTTVFCVNGKHTPNKLRTYKAAASMYYVVTDITDVVVLLGDQHVAVKWSDTKRKIDYNSSHLAAYGAQRLSTISEGVTQALMERYTWP